MTLGAKSGVRFIFTNLIFCNTEASMRAIFNGMCNGRQVHRETEVLSPSPPPDHYPHPHSSFLVVIVFSF